MEYAVAEADAWALVRVANWQGHVHLPRASGVRAAQTGGPSQARKRTRTRTQATTTSDENRREQRRKHTAHTFATETARCSPVFRSLELDEEVAGVVVLAQTDLVVRHHPGVGGEHASELHDKTRTWRTQGARHDHSRFAAACGPLLSPLHPAATTQPAAAPPTRKAAPTATRNECRILLTPAPVVLPDALREPVRAIAGLPIKSLPRPERDSQNAVAELAGGRADGFPGAALRGAQHETQPAISTLTTSSRPSLGAWLGSPCLCASLSGRRGRVCGGVLWKGCARGRGEGRRQVSRR